jgi:hypothetical protein
MFPFLFYFHNFKRIKLLLFFAENRSKPPKNVENITIFHFTAIYLGAKIIANFFAENRSKSPNIVIITLTSSFPWQP